MYFCFVTDYSSIILFNNFRMIQAMSDRPMTTENLDKNVEKIDETAEKQKKLEREAYMDLRINADDQSSCKTGCYWITIIVTIFMAAILSIVVLPDALLYKAQKDSLVGTNLGHCRYHLIRQGNALACGPYYSPHISGQYITGVEKLNQFLVFYLDVNFGGRLVLLDQHVKFRLYSVSRTDLPNGLQQLVPGEILKQEEIHIDSDYYYQKYYYVNYVKQLEEGQQFYWEVQFKGGSRANDFKYGLKSFVVNPEYTAFCMVLRMIFFVLSICFGCVYWSKYRKISSGVGVHNRVLPEQKVILLLSLATLTFNDPLYILTLLDHNKGTLFINTLFTWNFITLLFVIWGFFLLRIKEEEGMIHTQLAKKQYVIPIVIFYIINMVYRVGFAMYQVSDRPFTNPNHADSIFVNIMYAISIFVFLFALLYILLLYCDLCGRQNSQYLWRNIMFRNLSFFFYVITFGIFVFGGFDIFQFSSSKLIVTYTFMNFFSFYLQYLYMPSAQMLNQEENEQKDEKDENMDKFTIIDDEVSIDLNKHYDYLVEFGGDSVLQDNGGKPALSYVGQNLKYQMPSVFHENDEIKASKIDYSLSSKGSKLSEDREEEMKKEEVIRDGEEKESKNEDDNFEIVNSSL